MSLDFEHGLSISLSGQVCPEIELKVVNKLNQNDIWFDQVVGFLAIVPSGQSEPEITSLIMILKFLAQSKVMVRVTQKDFWDFKKVGFCLRN